MLPHFFRPSALQDETRFLAWRLGLPQPPPSELMKRGTIAEQVALRGTLAVIGEWVSIPATIPINPASDKGSRYKDWKAWSAATGIDKDAENAIDADTWAEAVGAAQAIRAALPDEFDWQKAGRLDLNVEVPEGFAPAIVGTCDLLLPEAVIDIKVVSNAAERALTWDYQMQVSAYAHMHDRPHVAILAAYPLDTECTRWSTKIVQMERMPIEAIEAQCNRLTLAYRRALASQSFLTDLSLPFKA